MDAFLMGNGYSCAVDNDGMYELAQDTASYRERGISHDAQLAKITETLEDFTVEIEVLQSVHISDAQMRKNLHEFCRQQLTVRRSVRRHPYNHLTKPYNDL